MPDAKDAGITRKAELDLSLRFRQNRYPWALNRGAGINKNAGVEKYISKRTHIGRERRGEDNPVEGLSLAPCSLVGLSAVPSTSQQSGSHSIFHSNCLVSHYIPLNIEPISLLTRLSVTAELHWHSQSLSPVGPRSLHMCVFVCMRDTACMCQFQTSATYYGSLAATHWRLQSTRGLNWTISIDLQWYRWAWPFGWPIE